MCGDRIVRKAVSMAAASLLTLALVTLPAAPRLDDISFHGTAAYAKGGNGGGKGGGHSGQSSGATADASTDSHGKGHAGRGLGHSKDHGPDADAEDSETSASGSPRP